MATEKETTKKPVVHHVAPKAHAPVAASHAKAARYTEAVGRRKTAIARVRIMAGTGKMTVNDKDIKMYFVMPRLVAAARAPFDQLKIADMDVTVHISGGGLHSQAEAIRLGLSRAIVMKDAEWKPRLRTIGFMTRDSRMVERKKYGKKKARRSPQWAKR
jgi:small subunit ribosomal protein S9